MRQMPEVTDADRIRSLERQCGMLRDQRDAERAENQGLRAVLDAARNITDDWCDSFNVTEFGCTCPVHDLIARVRDADAATR